MGGIINQDREHLLACISELRRDLDIARQRYRVELDAQSDSIKSLLIALRAGTERLRAIADRQPRWRVFLRRELRDLATTLEDHVTKERYDGRWSRLWQAVMRTGGPS